MSDSAWTYAVGKISPKRQKLMEVTKKALYLGIDQAVVGNRLGDIGYAIQHYTEDEMGYGDVRELIGHGIQPTMHEAPNVPHYGEPGHGLRLKAGMTITIEPMITTGTWKIKLSRCPTMTGNITSLLMALTAPSMSTPWLLRMTDQRFLQVRIMRPTRSICCDSLTRLTRVGLVFLHPGVEAKCDKV